MFENCLFINGASCLVDPYVLIAIVWTSESGRRSTNLQLWQLRDCWHAGENRTSFYRHVAWAQITRDSTTTAWTRRSWAWEVIILPVDWELVLPGLASPVGTHQSTRMHQNFIGALVLWSTKVTGLTVTIVIENTIIGDNWYVSWPYAILAYMNIHEHSESRNMITCMQKQHSDFSSADYCSCVHTWMSL